MSELEKIARHIVRHEEERQVEKIKLESEIKALEEVLEHGISTEFAEEEVIYIYSPKTAHDMRERLYENYKQLHAQLTIPKSVADKLDDIFNRFVSERDSHSIWALLWRAEEIDWEIGEQLYYLLPDENQVNIGIAYLAGKALSVDLVKVVEGLNETILGN